MVSSFTWKPISGLGSGGGGAMSWRMASNRERMVVSWPAIFFFQLGQFASQLSVATQYLAQLDEGTHNRDIHLYRALTPEHAR
jgi:hypothetical protein